MNLLNTKEQFGQVAQVLHWLSALLIIGLIGLGKYMHALPIDGEEAINNKVFLYSLHKSLGLLVFALAIFRVFWMFTNPKPAHLNTHSKLEVIASSTIHWFLYCAILLMPLSGWLMHSAETGFSAPVFILGSFKIPLIPNSENFASFFGAWHEVLVFMAALSILAHIAGALKHQFIDKDATLKRMLPFVTGPSFKGTTQEVSLAKSLPKFLAVGGVLLSLMIAGLSLTRGEDKHRGSDLDINQETSGASNWTVNKENSFITIEGLQSGQTFSGEFKNWTADISFDPQDLKASSVNTVIDMSSLRMGSKQDEETVAGAAFFDLENFKTASFGSEDFQKQGVNQYLARGNLKIKDISLPYDLPFSLEIVGDQAEMNATADLNRLPYQIGTGSWSDNATISHIIKLNIKVLAKRQ